MRTVPSGQVVFRRSVILLGGSLMAMILWFVLQDPAEGLRADWVSFDNAGSRLVNGETIYRPWNGTTEPFPYLYPPFALWLALPLAFGGFYTSLVMSVAFTFGAFLGGIKLLTRVATSGDLPLPTPAAVTTGIIAAVTTGAAFNSSLIGQYSGVYVFAVGLGLWLYANDRPVLGGMALSILLLKPNIAIAIPVVLVWSRSWKSLLGFSAGSVLAFVASIPFGLEQWSGFITNVRQIADFQAEGIIPTERMITFNAMFEELFGTSPESLVGVGAWLIFTGLTGVATLVVWTPSRLRESPQRAFCVLAIFVIIANPRMFFYDGTLVVFGVVGLWLLPAGVLGERTRHVFPVVGAILWLASWGGAFTILNLLVAPVGALLIVLVAIEAFTQSGRGEGESFEDEVVPDIDFDTSVGQGASWGDGPAAAAA